LGVVEGDLAEETGPQGPPDRIEPGLRGPRTDEHEAPRRRVEIARRVLEQIGADPGDALVRRPADRDPLDGPRAHRSRGAGGSRPSAGSCSGKTEAGAFVMRSMPEVVFGNAMTSRSDDAPAAIAQMRSRPRAMPPWGGAP